ncbi:DNA-directed RNA polymerase II subunit RPB1-like [Panicum virgatum]|uniref:DNA-directed RNA polymerase II subunit RPB1-like n=1 Tax=Panicum virgatum TaxID=38727 RepID=UPI0019D55C63|nr:DNA-directed RNA polymerase II subunit RPB1-like [Panicum virgatum]
MARVLSFVEFGAEHRRCPSSPDYSPLAAAPSPRAASPEYTPVSLLWRAGTPEHAPSTALRLGPPMPPPPSPRRAASPDYPPSSSPSHPAWREHAPLVRCGWGVTSADYAPSSTPTTSRAASPDYAPSTPTTFRVASPEYTPVSRLWRAAGSPDYRPSHPPPGAESPDGAPRSCESTPARRITGLQAPGASCGRAAVSRLQPKHVAPVGASLRRGVMHVAGTPLPPPTPSPVPEKRRRQLHLERQWDQAPSCLLGAPSCIPHEHYSSCVIVACLGISIECLNFSARSL